MAAGPGSYVDVNVPGSIAIDARNNYLSFGSVMLWDASQAWGEYGALEGILYLTPSTLTADNRYDLSLSRT